MRNLTPFVAGIIMVVSGALVLIFRAWLAPTIASLQRATFGKAGENLASKASAKGLIAPGVMFILIGVGMVLLSLFYHRSPRS
jgi:hypothetical protein